MQAGHFSRTAEVMTFIRAMETARGEGNRLYADPFALRFLGRPWRALASLSAVPILGPCLARILDGFLPGARSSGTARTRLIDDWVTEAVTAGSRQILILGAGFDSRAWRLPALSGLPVFEVDHPATSAEKRKRILALQADVECVVFVPLDFDRGTLPHALDGAGFDRTRATTIIWEGVSNYLSASAVDAVLAWVGGLAPGSRMIFTYIDAAVLTDPGRFWGATKALRAVERTGEPWTFGLPPGILPRLLEGHRMKRLCDLGADDYRARYFGSRAARMRGYAIYRAVLAEVGATHA